MRPGRALPQSHGRHSFVKDGPHPRVMKPLIIGHGEARSPRTSSNRSAIYWQRPARRFPSKRKSSARAAIILQTSRLTRQRQGIVQKEIEDQLLHAEIQVAVHSLKDLPTILLMG